MYYLSIVILAPPLGAKDRSCITVIVSGHMFVLSVLCRKFKSKSISSKIQAEQITAKNCGYIGVLYFICRYFILENKY